MISIKWIVGGDKQVYFDEASWACVPRIGESIYDDNCKYYVVIDVCYININEVEVVVTPK